MTIATLLIAVIILVALFYIIGLIPNPTIKKVATVVLVIAALFWLVRHMSALLNLQLQG